MSYLDNFPQGKRGAMRSGYWVLMVLMVNGKFDTEKEISNGVGIMILK